MSTELAILPSPLAPIVVKPPSKESKKTNRKLDLNPPPHTTSPGISAEEKHEAIQTVVNLCLESTLPTFTDLSSETIAKKFLTLSFPPRQEVDCYCNAGKDLGHPECTVLRGGNKDKLFYISLAHKTSELSGKRSLNLFFRFDPSVDKPTMAIVAIQFWDLLRILAKLENIPQERVLPFIPDTLPIYHIIPLCISLNPDVIHIIADIINTIMTIWPSYLHLTLSSLGRYTPLEVHATLPGSTHSKYWHSSTLLTDFNEDGVHNYITYQGVFNRHRKPSSRDLNSIFDLNPPLNPNLRDATPAIVNLIRTSSSIIQGRVVQLASEGGKLPSEPTQVNTTQLLQKYNLISNYCLGTRPGPRNGVRINFPAASLPMFHNLLNYAFFFNLIYLHDSLLKPHITLTFFSDP